MTELHSNPNVDTREAQILRALIENYIVTAAPVASKTLSNSANFGISPATIRSVMVELTDMGLLEQPHPSAGRVPTQKGFRFYIDCLLQVNPLEEGLKRRIREAIEANPEPQAILQNVSRTLSGISHQVGILLAPKIEVSRLKHIEFLDLREGKVLAILVTDQGVVQNRLLEVDETLNSSDLSRINRYLNSLLGGLTLSEIKTRVLLEMEKNKDTLDELLRRALILSGEMVHGGDVDLFIEGEKNFFYTQEFSNLTKIRDILEALSEKHRLVDFLERVSNAPGVQIFVGSEADPLRLNDCSVVVANYGGKQKPLGALGVIGPTRMEYSKLIPVVEFTAQLLGEALEM